MFKDRDVGVLLLGSLLGIGTLALPFSLLTRAILAMILFALFLIIALARFGPDRVPLETFLWRRWRYARRHRRYVYHKERPTVAEAPTPSPVQETPQQAPPPPKVERPIPAPSFRPVSMSSDMGIEPVLSAALSVLAAYIAYWLYTGGAQELANILQLGGMR